MMNSNQYPPCSNGLHIKDNGNDTNQKMNAAGYSFAIKTALSPIKCHIQFAISSNHDALTWPTSKKALAVASSISKNCNGAKSDLDLKTNVLNEFGRYISISSYNINIIFANYLIKMYGVSSTLHRLCLGLVEYVSSSNSILMDSIFSVNPHSNQLVPMNMGNVDTLLSLEAIEVPDYFHQLPNLSYIGAITIFKQFALENSIFSNFLFRSFYARLGVERFPCMYYEIPEDDLITDDETYSNSGFSMTVLNNAMFLTPQQLEIIEETADYVWSENSHGGESDSDTLEELLYPLENSYQDFSERYFSLEYTSSDDEGYSNASRLRSPGVIQGININSGSRDDTTSSTEISSNRIFLHSRDPFPQSVRLRSYEDMLHTTGITEIIRTQSIPPIRRSWSGHNLYGQFYAPRYMTAEFYDDIDEEQESIGSLEIEDITDLTFRIEEVLPARAFSPVVEMEEVEEASGENCTICKNEEGVTTMKKIPCGHVFHDECIKRWLRIKKSCPLCRYAF